MKRLRSNEDFDSFGEKAVFKDWGRRDDETSLSRSSSHRSFHYKPENGREGVSSSFSSRYDRLDEDRESSRFVRQRSDYDLETYDRRMGHDHRYREGSERGILSSSPRSGYSGDRNHRSESFSRSPRRDIPKGFRSERDRSRREGSVSSWRRFGMEKDFDDTTLGGVNKVGSEEKGNLRFSQNTREPKSPRCLGSEQPRSTNMKDSRIEYSKSTNKIKELESGQSKSNKVKEVESELPKSTKMKGLESDQSKGTKTKGLESEQSKGTKTKGLESEQSKGTKMKGLEIEHSKSTKTKGIESEQSKSTKSKDLGSEQSKSTEMKDLESEETKSTKTTESENLVVEGGCSSEMEEGELEPEPEPEAKEGNEMLQNKLESEELAENKVEENGRNSVFSVELYKDSIGREERKNGVKSVPEVNSNIDGFREEKLKFESQNSVEDLVETVNESAHNQRSVVNENSFATTTEIGESKEENRPGENKDESLKELIRPKKQDHEEGNIKDRVIEVADSGFTEPDNVVCESGEVAKVALSERMYDISTSFKDKGKSVAISFSNATCSEKEEEEEGFQVPRESNHLLNFEPHDMEGPSTKSLNLFLNHPVKQPEKKLLSGSGDPKGEKLELEPFELSLSLPNVLLPVNRGPAPSSPSHARSIQSIPSTFLTNSDGFTASMSFTGSQSVRHNPSCSLTNNSLDQFEHSVSSRPLFGNPAIWQSQPSNERNQIEVPKFQKSLSNGNEFLLQDQQLKVAEGSSVPPGLNRQLSLHRQVVSTNSMQSAGSRENRSEYSNDKKHVLRKKVSSSLYMTKDQNEEQFGTGEAVSVEPIITMIVSEPLDEMTVKFNKMNEKNITVLKDGVHDIIVNAGKRWQLSLFQKALNNRSDITLEMLLKVDRSQLEILVALKTGVGGFLKRNQNISSSDMAEIYLNLRCQNLNCRNLLPVDECDCKVCTRKSGFCSICMCLVCSKYDMASNTCSWVGCDVCFHWCHADCALQKSYIRNGNSSCGTRGLREMQFHCVECDHPSEMFGFVKEVFQTFAKEWTEEKLSKELEYVKKIFSASDDMRGKQLYDIAFVMLARLANKADFREVQNQIMSFLAESSSVESDNPTVRSGMGLFNKNQERKDMMGGPSQKTAWLNPPLHSQKTPQLEKVSSFNPYLNNNITTADPDLQRSVQKEPVFDELDSIVRMKEAEAKLFQTRADDARREAEGLKRIAMVKNQKIEEEYNSQISKLRLLEAEETRKRKLEELQGLERSYREYFSMKTRMEADIRELLSKMEATKQNLAL